MSTQTSLAGACALALLASAMPLHAQSGAAASAGVTLAPRNGQSADQQTADRSECAHWAKGQTGFDETLPGGGVAASEYPAKRQQYVRAMGACLDAHGYSVQYTAPAAPPASGYSAAPHVVYSQPSGPVYGPTIYSTTYESTPAFTWSPFHVYVDGGVTFTAGDAGSNFDEGGNVGVGFSVFPVRDVPLGLRVDGSYAYFQARDEFLYATNASYGHQEVYGGDVDLQVNLVQLPRQQIYVLGGIGWYRERTDLHQISFANGACDFYFCGGGGLYGANDAEATYTTSWHDAWNTGVGWEFAVADRGSVFVEARYLRIRPNSDGQQFVPVTIGFRF